MPSTSSDSAPARQRTALIIPVPAAEPLVSDWRARHDPAAAAGVPAHITLIFPFRPLDQIATGLLDDLRAQFAQTAAIPFTLAALGSFSGVLYLAPEPASPFVALIKELAGRYPDAPPYGGVHPRITPHLTVAHPPNPADLDGVAAAFAAAAQAGLPIAAVAREVWLMAEGPDRWQPHAVFPFGPASAHPSSC